MRRLPLWISTVAICGIPLLAAAHTGGPLDADGCHADHRTGHYHCHRGAAAGYTFPDKVAMQEAVRTGKFPEKSVEEEGFFSKLWPFGKHDGEETGEAAAEPGSGAVGTPLATPPGVGTNASVPEKQREFEQRLKILQGLYEMGLITKEEYEDKRKAVLDQL